MDKNKSALKGTFSLQVFAKYFWFVLVHTLLINKRELLGIILPPVNLTHENSPY